MIVGPCTVVTGGPEPKVYEGAGVRVMGSHIAQIAGAGDLARGLALRTPAEWRAYDRALCVEDVSHAVAAALVEGLRHGVTTVVDFHRSGACLDLSLSEVMGAAERVGARVATCYGAAEEDTPLERRAAIDESVGFAKELARKRRGKVRGMLGVQAATLHGIETLLAEAMDAARGDCALHVDLALDMLPAARWSRPDSLPADAMPALWAHAERAPRGLLGAVRERGDALSAVGASASVALMREADVAWGSDDGANSPPLLERVPGPAMVAAHYRRLFVNGARWAADHFGEELGVVAPGAPADLVLLDYRPATEFSSRTFLQHLSTGLLRSSVSGVMVAGHVLMDNGVIVSVDEREVAARARECAARLWKRIG